MNKDEQHQYRLLLMKLYLGYVVNAENLPAVIKEQFDRMVKEQKLVLSRKGFYKVSKKRYFEDAFQKVIDRQHEKLNNKGK